MHIVDVLEFIVAAGLVFGFLLLVYSVIISYLPDLDLYEPATLMSFGLLGFILILLRTDLFDDIKEKWRTDDDKYEEKRKKQEWDDAVAVAERQKKEYEDKLKAAKEDAKYICRPTASWSKDKPVTIAGQTVVPSKKGD